ncbi:MAG: ShET2/EspL2 family type III secretion system effector toxin [Oxalobacteraceae bacterium]|nr:ShET2/EspL2 family type III secretion system effector toxin [Oxalobacteraceae bacterium]
MQRLTALLKNTFTCGAPDAMPEPDPRFEQRKQRLYPPGLATTPLDRDVLACTANDTPQAAALRRQLQGRKSLRQAWQKAARASRPDKLRALLLLFDERRISTELARPRFNSPLQQARNRPGLTDTALDQAIKQYPYFPTGWRERGVPVPPRNFNAEPVVCRHLAMHHLRQMATAPGTLKCDLHEEFSSLETIRHKVDPDHMEQHYQALCARAGTSHLIANERFGAFLAGQFRAMESADPHIPQSTRLMLLESTKHTMSVGLRIKQDGNRTVYVVKVFDPNLSTHHARSRTDDLAMLEHKTLNDWLVDDNRPGIYYPEANAVSLLFVLDASDPIAPDANAVPRPGRLLASLDCALDATVMHHLLCDGFTGNLRQLAATFATLPDEQKITLLAGKNDKDEPGLYKAFQRGHADTMHAFAILLALVPQAARHALLMAWHPEAVPGLYAAFLGGHADLLRAYCAPLQLVPPSGRSSLLAASTEGVAGLHCAFFLPGQAEVIRAFSAPLALVPEADRAALVAAKNRRGENGVLVALRHGHADAIRAFRDLLEMVPQEQRANLLPPVDHAAASDSEHQAAIDAYESLRRWHSGSRRR